MCYHCYKEYGEPKIINDTTKSVASLIKIIYSFSPVGGHAHAVFDDWNIDDLTIKRCLYDIRFASDDQSKIERNCLREFKKLNTQERASALALFEGWIN